MASVTQSQFPRMHRDPDEARAEWTAGTKFPVSLAAATDDPSTHSSSFCFFPLAGSGAKSLLSTSPKQTNRRHFKVWGHAGQRVAQIRLKINIEHTLFVHVATAQGQPSSKLLHRLLSSSISQHQHQSRSSCSSRHRVQHGDAYLLLSLWANRSSAQMMLTEQGRYAPGNPGKIRINWILRFRWRISSIFAFKNQHDYFSRGCPSTRINSH